MEVDHKHVKNHNTPIPFNTNLKLLRTTYDLSLNEFGNLIGLSKTSVNLLENGKSKQPLFSTALAISNIFGVSLSWLGGQVNNPYSSESIMTAENYLFNLINIIKNGNHLKNIELNIYKDYSNPITRIKVYDKLAIRANIIVLIHLTLLPWIKTQSKKKNQINELSFLNTNTSHKITKRYNNLHILLRLSTKKPIYNLTIKKKKLAQPFI